MPRVAIQARAAILSFLCVLGVAPVAPAMEPAAAEVRPSPTFLAPFIGVNVPLAGDLGAGAPDDQVGVRAGIIVGRRLAPNWSLAGQATFDLLEFKVAGAVDAFLFRADLAPFFHWGGPRAELLLGPLLGGWYYRAEATPYGLNEPRHGESSRGLTYGANVGGLLSSSSGFRGGLLVSLTFHRGLDLCPTLAYASFSCNPDPSRSLAVLGVTLVVWF